MKRLFLLFTMLSLFSCNDDPDNPYTLIEYGTACGWGVSEFITISEDKINFNQTYYEEGKLKTEIKSKTMSDSNWNELSNLYDYGFFQTLDYNSMNVSYDGCDEIIRITQVDNEHEIRYNPLTEIEGLEIFQERLNELLSEMREY